MLKTFTIYIGKTKKVKDTSNFQWKNHKCEGHSQIPTKQLKRLKTFNKWKNQNTIDNT
jgi:hypothetical protein